MRMYFFWREKPLSKDAFVYMLQDVCVGFAFSDVKSMGPQSSGIVVPCQHCRHNEATNF